MYILRLDDAAENMNWKNWQRMELILDKYDIKPIFGIIPNNQDPDLLKYEKLDDFWDEMNRWKNKKWIPALHGYTHVFETMDGGINPVNLRSEFAGVSLERQKEKIYNGVSILKKHDINAKIFFAPAHTFDMNTLEALKTESDIRIISDTVANDLYYSNGFYFVPQQSGQVRKLPFKICTFCYHPNIMKDEEFDKLNQFLNMYRNQFIDPSLLVLKKKKLSNIDKILRKLYFIRKK